MPISQWWSSFFSTLTPDSLASAVATQAIGAQVQLEGVQKVFQEGEVERTVLNQVDFTFNPGEFVVLLGHSGSGKSTLLNLISGIDQPSAGTVRINGLAITELDERSRTPLPPRPHRICFPVL